MDILHHNGTWDPVPLPHGKKTIACRWVYIVKFNPDGSVEQLKVRFVTKDFTPTYDIDYEKTFSHVVKIYFICVDFFGC